MEIEFDPTKDALNRAKHNGLSLRLGASILAGRVGEVEDDRQDYGEVRINAFGRVRGTLYVCTYTRRGDAHRIISVRFATKQERTTWLP